MTPYSNDEVDYHYVTDEDMKKLLDAEWNKAIDAAAESAKADWSGMAKVWVDKQSILKLKR